LKNKSQKREHCQSFKTIVLTKNLKNLDDNDFNFEKEAPKKTFVKTLNHHFIFLAKIT
jgi:hypothetical protein